MSARHFLFGFSGRVNRAKLWLWILIAFVFTIVMMVIAGVGFDWSAPLAAIKQQHAPIDWAKVPHPACKGAVSIAALVALGLLYIAYVWSKLAIYAKRLHDRGRTAWWLLVYVGLPAVLVLGTHCPAMHPGAATAFARVLSVVIGIVVFIDLFCLKGTKGANKFGADPLEPNWCDPEKPEKGCTPRPEL